MADDLLYHQRSQRVVDPPYQLRVVTHLLVIVLAVGMVSGFAAMGLLWRTMFQTDYQNNGLLIAALTAVALTLLIELVIAIPMVLVLGIRQSHRVVGPMRRMIQTLEDIGGGNFSRRLTLRPGDALEDLAKAINRMAENLDRRFPQA